LTRLVWRVPLDRMSEVRRFPVPWTIDGNHCCYWVKDAAGKTFGYTYFNDTPGGIGTAYAAKLTRAEALRIVRNIAKLPELLKR
jgi:hypothetical protein